MKNIQISIKHNLRCLSLIFLLSFSSNSCGVIKEDANHVSFWNLEIGSTFVEERDFTFRNTQGWELNIQKAFMNIEAIYLNTEAEKSTLALISDKISNLIIPQVHAHAGHGISTRSTLAEVLNPQSIDILGLSGHKYEHLFAYTGQISRIKLRFPSDRYLLYIEGIATKDTQKLQFKIQIDLENIPSATYALLDTKHYLNSKSKLLLEIDLTKILQDLSFTAIDAHYFEDNETYVVSREKGDLLYTQISRRLRQKESYILKWE